ncbi:hypothetical protein [Verminephrobacter eiseniae]|uniref:hypothetical protein n=1 Tax=Verminephrobacter eiseniae TaxID=364317 RepID=UPI0022389B3C|nr:hypothetical protein [Verminephrobacter eiseniae]
MSRHRSSVGLRWPSKHIAALHRLPIRSVWAARCALRCAPMAARSLRHLIGDATLAVRSPPQNPARAGGIGPGQGHGSGALAGGPFPPAPKPVPDRPDETRTPRSHRSLSPTRQARQRCDGHPQPGATGPPYGTVWPLPKAPGRVPSPVWFHS